MGVGSPESKDTTLGRKARFAMLLGRRDWVEDGRCGVPLPTMLINFWFQRILRVNGRCGFPVHFTSTVVCPAGVQVGRGVAQYLASSGGMYIQAMNGVVLGDDTLIAPGVKIVSSNHAGTSATEWTKHDPVIVGARCWIGANAVILPGVTVGDDSIIGAGAVVTHHVPADSLAVGVPAVSRPRNIHVRVDAM